MIFGASGSGTTTLGRMVANQLNWIHLDVDDYLLKKKKPPFQEKVSPDQWHAPSFRTLKPIEI